MVPADTPDEDVQETCLQGAVVGGTAPPGGSAEAPPATGAAAAATALEAREASAEESEAEALAGSSADNGVECAPVFHVPQVPKVGLLHVLDLHDVIDALGGASCDPVVLACLGLTCRQLQSFIASPGFAVRRAEDLRAAGAEWAEGCTSLAQLDVGLSVARFCERRSKNHLYFPYGGGTEVKPVTRPLLDLAVGLGRRHAGLRLHVDAHTGAGAPPGIAVGCAQRRAQAVMQDLCRRGVDSDRLSGTPWGKKVAMVWSEPEDDTAARAELFFRFGSKEFPRREAYYDLVPENKRPQPGRIDQPEAEEDDEEDPARVFLTRLMFPGILPSNGVVRLPTGRRVPLSALFAQLRRGGEDEEEEGNLPSLPSSPSSDEDAAPPEAAAAAAAGDDEAVGLLDGQESD